MKNLNAYHNAFYAKTSDDLKYKKDRCVNGNFEIRFSYHDNDIIIARSYWTDIATIDNANRLMIISWSRYSHTTGKQIDELIRACPADYKIVFVPSEQILGDMATKQRINQIAYTAGKESLDWVNGHKYKTKDRADWLKHLKNIKSLPAHTKIARLQNYLENMQNKRRFVMIVLDEQPDKTTRLFYWSRYGSATGVLTTRLGKASVFESADDCERAFDNDGGDSFLQQENGDSLTYDKTRGDAGDYTYERYILEI